ERGADPDNTRSWRSRRRRADHRPRRQPHDCRAGAPGAAWRGRATRPTGGGRSPSGLSKVRADFAWTSPGGAKVLERLDAVEAAREKLECVQDLLAQELGARHRVAAPSPVFAVGEHLGGELAHHPQLLAA